MKTAVPKPAEQAEQWHRVDAAGVVLGRLATRVATILRGKHEPTFSPHLSTKNHVVIVNADKVRVTGQKGQDKLYYRHGRQPGTLRSRNLDEVRARFPTRPIEEAIRRMLPDNKLRSTWMNHLHVYASSQHPHDAQRPTEVKIDG